ncbi:MAG: radical SAM protein, partial [Patescibacteria group bacterium]
MKLKLITLEPQKKKLIRITKESGIPLLGALPFGCIDRGSNILQVRCTTICNMNCQFCSTDGGPYSTKHSTNYVVDIDYLLESVKEVVKFKGNDVQIFLDSVGDPLTHPDFV